MHYEFRVTDTPPAAKSWGGGRKRSNVFDEWVLRSYQENYAGTDEWVEVQVPSDEDSIKKVTGQIRNAGSYLTEHGHGNIGTEVRSDPYGRVCFRGVERKERASGRESQHAAQDDSSQGDDAYYDSYSADGR